MSKTLALLAGLAMSLLVACGEEEPTTAQDTTAQSEEEPTTAASEQVQSESPTEFPVCSELWTAGATLPDPYEGCEDESGFVEPESYNCSSGQVIVTFADRYYAALGGPVNDGGTLSTSEEFEEVLAECGA